MKSEFKDLFLDQSIDYAKFRTTYPAVLFDYLAQISKSKDLAWDCRTGNGQPPPSGAMKTLAEVANNIDASVLKLYSGTLGPYWEKERKLINDSG